MDDQTTSGATVAASGGVGFLGALVAVFLGGAISGTVASLLSVYRLTWSETSTLMLTTFASILIGAIAIKVILGYMDADVSLTVAAITMILGNLLPLLTTSIRLQAEAHAARQNPVVLPSSGLASPHSAA